MNIYEALKDKDKDLRLTRGHYKWLVWDECIGEWAVFSRERYQRMTGCLYHGDSCDEAVAVLCEGE